VGGRAEGVGSNVCDEGFGWGGDDLGVRAHY
jgi:hypothetical protein